MSATVVRSSSTVRAGARSVVFVAQEIVNTLYKIIGAYSVSGGCLVDKPDVVPRGLMVWISAGQLRSVVLELIDGNGKLIRKFEMPIDYTVSEDEEEILRSNVSSLEAFLKTDRPGPLAQYRVYGLMNCSRWIEVPGWGNGKLSDDRHLTRQELSADHIKTKHMQVGIAVFTGTGQKIGEAT